MINTLSLFANVGIAETYLKDIGINVVVANELVAQRVKFYKYVYSNTNMIEGDITNDDIQKKIISCSKKANVDLIMATPPCQGMSTAGKHDKNDIRNFLICPAIKIIKEIKPKYVFLENVTEQLKTEIIYNNKKALIPDYINEELGKLYNINPNHIVNAQDYSVPQSRQRAIFLMVRKDLNKTWNFPKKGRIVTLDEAIGDFPSVDPEVYDITYEKQIKLFPQYEEKKAKALAFSKWHYPPKHVYRQVFSIMHTPTGETAFNNIPIFRPKKTDGTYVKGFKNTYKRQYWNKPGSTITMFNRTIGSQDNVHPGRYLGKDLEGYDIYSDARVLTIKELMTISSLPDNWNVPDWATDHFIRQVIGEGIPPLLVKKIMEGIIKI